MSSKIKSKRSKRRSKRNSNNSVSVRRCVGEWGARSIQRRCGCRSGRRVSRLEGAEDGAVVFDEVCDELVHGADEGEALDADVALLLDDDGA